MAQVRYIKYQTSVVVLEYNHQFRITVDHYSYSFLSSLQLATPSTGNALKSSEHLIWSTTPQD